MQMQNAQPSLQELEEMLQKTQVVVRLLQDFHQMTMPDADQGREPEFTIAAPMQVTPDGLRSPKQSWEGISQEDNDPQVSMNSTFEVRSFF